MKKSGILIGFAAAAAALAVLASSMVVTYPDEYRLVKQFGEIVKVVKEPGVSFKVPFIQTSTSVPKQLQLYDIPKSDVITRDKKTMITDAFVLWKISDPVLFTRHLNGQVAQAQSRISATVFSKKWECMPVAPTLPISSLSTRMHNPVFSGFSSSRIALREV